jgi:glycosyltransferase involved in cell wall biosynthesis
MYHQAVPEPPVLSSGWRRLGRNLPASLKGALRRQADYLLPNREAWEYRTWMAARLKHRALVYDEPLEPGLLSVLTPVWDGSPIQYLKTLASALIDQNQSGACEWVVLDNGCTNLRLRSYLDELRAHRWIQLYRLEKNAGIARGLRNCLEHAHGRYVMPVDADDLLYPDTLRIVTSCMRRCNYPPLLYSDEDKIIGTKVYQPYMKPDWDPVLLLNSAYIAHLGILDRQKALDLGAYSDANTEGSPDWDVFVRFLIAGYMAAHIPEVLYSWRVHAHSTADDAATKPYVHASQRAVLQRFLDARPRRTKFKIEYSPLLGGMAHWHFSREHNPSSSFIRVVLGCEEKPARALTELAKSAAQRDGFVHLIGDDVQIDDAAWPGEALSLFELHPDVVMIGGRIRNSKGTVMEGGRHFGFAGPCGDPNRGRSFTDPGYFGQMWKQRSVSAVATQFAVVRASFLYDVLQQVPEPASVAFLGAWAGALALRTGKRVVYSPFLSGVSDRDWDTLVDPDEQALFAHINQDIIPDRRFYSRNLSLERPFAFGSPEIGREGTHGADRSSCNAAG